MRVEIPDDQIRQYLGISRRTPIGPALLDWLYRDPRFDSNREILIGVWLLKRLAARAQAGEAIEDDAEERRIG